MYIYTCTLFLSYTVMSYLFFCFVNIHKETGFTRQRFHKFFVHPAGAMLGGFLGHALAGPQQIYK